MESQKELKMEKYLKETDLNLKARFFAQYFGQNVLTRPKSDNKKWILGEEVSINSELSKSGYDYQYYLELKPISQITEEDYKGIPELYYGSTDSWFNAQRIYTHETLEECVSKVIKKLKPTQYDYLRSKGYALPYMELSIETLQEYGWIKLKSE